MIDNIRAYYLIPGAAVRANEWRNTDRKHALYKAIADGLHAAVGLRREDFFSNLVEVKKENWSFGQGRSPVRGLRWRAL